ncbi:hypothetical protein D3C72_2381280 [compost metagenome]
MISVESISTTPLSQTSEGALTTGLMAWKRSNSRKTDTDSCVNGNPSRRSEIAVRRT